MDGIEGALSGIGELAGAVWHGGKLIYKVGKTGYKVVKSVATMGEVAGIASQAGGAVLQGGDAALGVISSVGGEIGGGLDQVGNAIEKAGEARIGYSLNAGPIHVSEEFGLFGSSSSTQIGSVYSHSEQMGGSSITDIFNRRSSTQIGALSMTSSDNGLWSTNSINGVQYVTPGHMVPRTLEGTRMVAEAASLAGSSRRHAGGIKRTPAPASFVKQVKASEPNANGYGVEETVAAICKITKKDETIVSEAVDTVREDRERLTMGNITTVLERLKVFSPLAKTLDVVGEVNRSRGQSQGRQL